MGVGSSVSEAFVQGLADATGGACELVSPNEDMARKIVRHFKRIYSSRAENVKILWPVEALETFPEQINTVYDGDTLHVFGRFVIRPEGDIELQVLLENGEQITQKLSLQPRACTRQQTKFPATTARMAAACELRGMKDPEQIAKLAVKYQLISRFTNYLAIDVKADGEKAADLPVLRKTPQMLAAGWGGSGTVFSRECSTVSYRLESTFMRKEMVDYSWPFAGSGLERLGRFIERLDYRRIDQFMAAAEITSINELEIKAAPEELVEALKELVNAGYDERIVVTVFLYLLSQEKQCKNVMSRSTRRIIKKAYKGLPEISDQLRQRIELEIESYLQKHGH